jgi:hypothetical protein
VQRRLQALGREMNEGRHDQVSIQVDLLIRQTDKAALCEID